MLDQLPLIDMSALLGDGGDAQAVARQITAACEAPGFFYLIGHLVTAAILSDLERESRAFFALPEGEKLDIAMARGGRAWRGFFPVGGELTSGRPDLKEGIYFGTELPAEDPRVGAGLALHGANLWPKRPAGLRGAVEAYMTAATRSAEALMRAVSLSLGLAPDHFAAHYLADPTVLFRIFHYPARPPSAGGEWDGAWGVGEHTDYGLLTLLAQDRHGGLQVKTPDGWIEAPPVPGTLVCNIGDMLERLTAGRYVSTPHRVLNRSGEDRLSFPLFYDPDFAARMTPLPLPAVTGARIEADRQARWDAASVHAYEGTYGDYLLAKVGKVFPELGRAALP